MDTSVFHLQRIFTLKESRPWRIQPVFVEDLYVILIGYLKVEDKYHLSFFRGFLVCFFTNFVIFVNNCLDFLLCSNSFPNEFFAVNFQNIGMFLHEKI